MSTFRVEPEQLVALAGRMQNAASGLFSVSSGGYGCAGSGDSGLDKAVAGFASHFGSYTNVMAQDLAELAVKVSAAGESYRAADDEIKAASC